MTDTPETPPEYVPFDMVCARCEYDPFCFLPLKVLNKVSYQWFRYLKFADRDHFCQQGRKRRNCRQVTIGEALEQRRSRNAELPGVGAE